MQDQEVARNSTARLGNVDGDLRVSKRARIEASDGMRVTVTKAVHFEGGGDVGCSLECNDLSVDHFGVVKINGDLNVRNTLDVAHSIDVAGKITAGTIDVGGKLRAGSLSAKKIRGSGIMEVKGDLEAENIQVTGKLLAPGHVKLGDFAITGVAELGGGDILGSLDVKGKLRAASKTTFGNVRIMGGVMLPPDCQATRVSTFGKLAALGNMKCDQIEVQGTTQIEGNLNSKNVWVRGKLEVNGDLSVAEVLETFGKTQVLGNYTGASLHVGGQLKATRVLLTGDVDIAGRMDIKHVLKAKTVTIRSGSRCESPIVAEKVEVGASYLTMGSLQTEWIGQNVSLRLIGKETKIGDAYALDVHLGTASSARNIYAKNVSLDKGCVVDQIVYTGELKLPGGAKSVYINHPPQRVEKLPTAPL
jgi:cytoskeletal protein CcmA (bactofilin family)